MEKVLKDLLSVISDYDWQIGITSTDHGDHGLHKLPTVQASWARYADIGQGKFGALMPLESATSIIDSPRILTKDFPDYEEVFHLSLSHKSLSECRSFPPYCQKNVEQPMRSLKSFIERVRYDNGPFFRIDSDFVAIILTNEDERKEDQARATRARDVVHTFKTHFGHLSKKFFAFSFLITDHGCLEHERRKLNLKPGVLYMPYLLPRLAEVTGGYNSSICDSNYGSKLRSLSQYVKHSIENSVLLKHEPHPQTIQVDFLEGEPVDWELVGRKILFDTEDSSIKVRVSYQRKLEGA